MKKDYIKSCDDFPQDGEYIIEVDLEIGWAWNKALPEHNFPIYKECCHFFEINPDGTKGDEVDFTEIKPVIIIPEEIDTCDKCHNNPPESNHSCPYKGDIYGDYDTQCNCCNSCYIDCAGCV
jgi:hypothetical protein